MHQTGESQTSKQKGLVVVFTGNGKGKTSAAMGVMTRARVHGLRVAVLQFIKSPERAYGEADAARRLGVPFESLGTGFVFNPEKGGQDRQATLAAWEKAKELISGGGTDVVILDEFTYPLTFGWLDTGEVVAWLKANKPDRLHLVLTGRNAPDELVEYADMVTEMREVRHPFRLQQIPAQKGIDF